MLRHDANGDLIARIMLVSTGRQNGKTIIVQGLFGWLLDEGRQLEPFAGWTEMLAAAHDARGSSATGGSGPQTRLGGRGHVPGGQRRLRLVARMVKELIERQSPE